MSRAGGTRRAPDRWRRSGKPVNTIYRFDRANVIVSLDADFLCSGMPGGLRYARDYAARRRAAAEDPSATPPRLYVAEGDAVDHRRHGGASLPHADVGGRGVRRRVASRTRRCARRSGRQGPERESRREHRHRGRASASARPRARARAERRRSATSGKTVIYTDPVEANPVDEIASLTRTGRTTCTAAPSRRC